MPDSCHQGVNRPYDSMSPGLPVSQLMQKPGGNLECQVQVWRIQTCKILENSHSMVISQHIRIYKIYIMIQTTYYKFVIGILSIVLQLRLALIQLESDL